MSNTNNDYFQYCNMPFCSEISHDDFYTFQSVTDLITNSKQKEVNIKIRTIGILKSENGNYFIKDINDKSENCSIHVSMNFVKTPLQSSAMPYTVQIFGSIQWKTKPVIYARIVQVLNATTALRLNKIMQRICSTHLAVLSS